jgi:hypothetical protein
MLKIVIISLNIYSMVFVFTKSVNMYGFGYFNVMDGLAILSGQIYTKPILTQFPSINASISEPPFFFSLYLKGSSGTTGILDVTMHLSLYNVILYIECNFLNICNVILYSFFF